MEPKSLDTKSLDELRTLARSTGLRGYSGLRKKQLIELLVKQKASPTKLNARKEKTAKSSDGRAKPAKPREKTSVDAKTSAKTTSTTPVTEEQIGSAKFQTTPPNTPLRQTFVSSLHEDIENLPASGESMLCLLPQKPGVVHAYWTLQPGAQTKPLKLRLCYASDDAMQLLDEVDVSGTSGHWYFQIPDTAELGSVIGHLGFYDTQGKFVTAIHRGIAHIPTLYASGATDRSWWISDDDFHAMYHRTGGVTRGKRLMWPASSSSSSQHK